MRTGRPAGAHSEHTYATYTWACSGCAWGHGNTQGRAHTHGGTGTHGAGVTHRVTGTHGAGVTGTLGLGSHMGSQVH